MQDVVWFFVFPELIGRFIRNLPKLSMPFKLRNSGMKPDFSLQFPWRYFGFVDNTVS